MGKDFSLRGMQKFPLKEIEEYIIQWCNPQHMTVVDDAGKMLHQGRSYTTLIQEQNTTWKKHTCKAR